MAAGEAVGVGGVASGTLIVWIGKNSSLIPMSWLFEAKAPIPKVEVALRACPLNCW